MYRDSLGNTYASLPTRPPVHTAKSTSSNAAGKAGRSKRAGDWVRKVKTREAHHRAKGHRFTAYSC